MTELLTTKLYIPRPRSNLVSRPRLTDFLNAGLDRKLTLIAAPAGFGKTTLLSEWIPQSPRCVTWLSLDEGDNEPARFWAYFIAALQMLNPDIGMGAQAWLQSSQRPDFEQILTMLINEIAAFPDAFAHVFDDYHLIENPDIDNTLAFVIDHQPANMHLVINSRADPDLPLSRLRARGQLVEIRAADLRFSFDEASLFLNQAMGLDLSEADILALEQRTEGWITGLQLAALSMQSSSDVDGFIKAFTGSNRYIVNYLIEEVLNQRPEGTLDFLLQTSILERMCGPLCDAVTRQADGGGTLRRLEHAHLLTMPLDDEGVWYRYHHLFADVLRAHLQQTQPNLVQDLHSRASTWHEQNGKLSEAVNHALAAQDFDQASRLIEQASRAMWQQGEVKILQNWLAALPPGIRCARPLLCLAQAWSALAVGQLDMVDAGILEAEEALSPLPKEEIKPLRAQVNALRSTLAGYRQNSAKAIELARQSLDHLPEEDHFLRGLLTYNLGWAYLSQGDLPAASQKLREAATFSLNAGDLSTASYALNALGAELGAQGRLREAASCYREVIQAIQKEGRPLAVTAASGAYVWLGRILYEWNQLDESAQRASQGIELSRPFQASGAMFVGYLVLTNVLMARDDLSGAVDSLRNAETAGRSNVVPKRALRMVESVRAHLWLAQMNIAEAAQWAMNYERNLNFPASGDWPDVRQLSPMFDYEYLTLVRVRMAQAQWDEALRLLARLRPVVEAGARKASLIKLLALRALALQRPSNRAESIAALERALTLTEPEGYVRTFLDEGEPMRLLIDDFRLSIAQRSPGSSPLLPYLDMLLSAFAGEGSGPTDDIISHQPSAINTLLDPLSERELEVLRLIRAGLNNQEIAGQLVIATSTVKTHINNLYGKIGVHSRTQAVAMAEDLGILADDPRS